MDNISIRLNCVMDHDSNPVKMTRHYCPIVSAKQHAFSILEVFEKRELNEERYAVPHQNATVADNLQNILYAIFFTSR